MEIKYFRLVKTIIEEGSIANSSKKLFLSQSALSHQLKELEHQLGYKVFYRTRNKWELTEEGVELYGLSNVVLENIDKSFKNIKQIQTKNLRLKEETNSDHLREMADYFNAELDEGYNGSTITMDNEKAKGFISSYQVFSGLSVWVYNITFLSDFKVELGMSEESPYYFCYNVQGQFLHRFGGESEFHTALQNQNMIVVGASDTSAQLVFPANIKLKIAVIIIDINLLKKLEIRNAKRIYTKIRKIFQKTNSKLPFRHLGEIDSETEKYASIVCENDCVDLVAGLLTEGAVLNMLASQIQVYSDHFTKKKVILNKLELSKITSLGAYVIDNFEASFTILKLSRHFGISPKKLQIGVKYLYGDSVAHYISNLRLAYAKNLFTTTNFNVSEVCHLVGIYSSSYFSKVFKNRYGVLPSHYRKQSSYS
ncbi:MAG: HTH-type transcriptional regulator MetR [Polaribacter sejongensis]|nr:MAG: HTH-type transcriptional regulator MetR [Polaribacter sejongensis]